MGVRPAIETAVIERTSQRPDPRSHSRIQRDGTVPRLDAVLVKQASSTSAAFEGASVWRSSRTLSSMPVRT